ncbi:hypothetical protein DPEC_G00320320 [Dallia pectoralis]|uniref:Uncharacterized protein n=1 Tax=Dallia pectoralis TaxID=75939 RepID=A0ACC2F9U8_DALPE|nr:hypothetical protein DPEC_G00320320 [Dallia pectoralis]
MASDGDQDEQWQDKFILKRKLTGPPRLLLGKCKSLNQGCDRSEDRTKKRNQRPSFNNGAQISSITKQSIIEVVEKDSSDPVVASDNLHATLNIDGDRASSGQPFDPASLNTGLEENKTSEDQLEGRSETGKSTGNGWKRVFSPALICIRRQRKFAAAQDDRLRRTPAKSTRDDTTSSSDRCVDGVVKRRRRFNIRTWPAFKRLLTASYVRRQRPRQGNVVQEEISEDASQKPSVTFSKRCQRFLTCGRKATLILRHKNTHCPGNKEAVLELKRTQDSGQQSPVALQGVTLLEEPGEVRGPCSERVTVNAEVIALQPNDGDPNVTATSLMPTVQRPIPTNGTRQGIDAVDTKTSLLAGTEETSSILEPETCGNSGTDTVPRVVDVVMDAGQIQVDELDDIACLEKDTVTQTACALVDTVHSVAMDTNEHPSEPNPIVYSEDVVKENYDEYCGLTEEQIFRNDGTSTSTVMYGHDVVQSSLRETSIAHPNGHEVEEGGGESLLPAEQSELLLCREILLVETARSLVQAAISAAMEQLSIEQNGTPVIVHREAPECRDHA